MATEVAVFDPKAQRPSYALVKQDASSITKALAGGGGFPGKRISIKGGVFRLIDAGKEVASIEDRHLDIVMVRAAEHIGRTYYSQPFNEDTPTAPDCWSADGLKPDVTAAHPQSAQCASCPQNIKGSGNEDSRACRFSQRVAVLLANDVEGDVLQLNLPATSLFGKEDGDSRPLQAYARYLSANNSNVEQFVTRVKFDLKAPNPKLFFKAMRWLETEEYAVAQEKGKTDEAIRACTMSVAQTDRTDVVTPTPAPAVKAVVAQPKVEEEPPAPPSSIGKKRGRPAKVEVAAPTPEPTLRAAPPAQELPKRSTAATIAANWDADD